MSKFYPQLEPRALTALTTIKQLLEADAGYLDDPSCMYDDDLKTQLKRLLEPKEIIVEKEVVVEKIIEKKVEVAALAAEGGKTGPKGPTKKAGSTNIDAVSAELKEVMKDLREMKLNAKTLQPADRIQVFKTQVALIEKMLTMEERATNIKKVSMFMSVVMGILDDAFTDEQRQNFMKRLEPFAKDE